MSCWRCDQKAEYRRNKLEKARCEAELLSKQLGQTVGIYKLGSLYKITALPATEIILEYINHANNGADNIPQKD